MRTKPLTATDPALVLGLQDEIRRSHGSRYDHRLHGVLLAAQGMSCREVARLLGDAPRTVQYWHRCFKAEGLAGLAETDRPGRPRALSEARWAQLGEALRQSPVQHGLEGHLWNGERLSALIERRYKIRLGVRQCQRLLRRLGFRRRKPRPEMARVVTLRQRSLKENSKR